MTTASFPFKNALVTGGAGFIGSHLVEALRAEGCEVSVIDDFNDFYDPLIKQGNVECFDRSVCIHKCDIRDREKVEAIFESSQFDVVYHLAARAGVRPSIQNPRLYLHTNVDGTLNLLEAARQFGVGHFVFASSSSIYGVNEKVPFSEDDRIERTISPYAASKLAGEQLCSNYARLYGMKIRCLRFFTVYGPRQRPDLAISRFVQKMRNGEEIEQYGDGSTQRDYTYIDDIISGIMSASKTMDEEFGIYNLGGCETTSLSDLIEKIGELLGVEPRIRRLPEQPGDVPKTYADIERARRVFGYEPKTTLREGISEFIKWAKS